MAEVFLISRTVAVTTGHGMMWNGACQNKQRGWGAEAMRAHLALREERVCVIAADNRGGLATQRLHTRRHEIDEPRAFRMPTTIGAQALRAPAAAHAKVQQAVFCAALRWPQHVPSYAPSSSSSSHWFMHNRCLKGPHRCRSSTEMADPLRLLL